MSGQGFELGEVIAQSARTVIRRAVRRSDGRPVVVKTLVNEYPSRSEVDQLESEYEILRKLDGLPHVIRTFGFERTHDRPLLVVEDIAGEAVMRRGGGPALPLDRFFAVAAAATKALEGIHAHNVIHGDLKPGNIVANWDTNDIRLIDFDAAWDRTGPRRESRETFEGSLPYMAPEQTGRMNRAPDHRADYYSLGITFYELLTGKLPFEAQDTMGWVHSHLSRMPTDITTAASSIPEALARIVHKLMAKNPDDRYQSGQGLLRDLERSRRDTGFALGAHDVSERFQISSRTYGRRAEIEAIMDAFASASRGAKEMVLLTGKAGMGRTAVLQEVERRIPPEQGRLLSSHLNQADRALPYAALVHVIRAFAKQVLAERDDQLAAWRRLLSEAIAPSGQILLDLVPELAPVIGAQPPLPALGPEEAHSRFRTAVQAFLGAMARPRSPLVLLLENLQWADPATVELLAGLMGSAEAANLLVVAAFRDPESDGDGIAAIPAVLREPVGLTPHMINLGPLSEDSVVELVMSATRAAPAAAASLARVVQKKTGGNPFFIHEFLNLLARDGALHLNRADGRWDWDPSAIARAAISDNVVDLMVQRLQRLPPATADVLRLGACIGDSFDVELLEGIAGAEPMTEALRDAVGKGLLLEGDGKASPRGGASAQRGEAGGRAAAHYRFHHARLQQAAYSLVDDEERQRVHLRIGRRLLERGAGRDTDDSLFDVVGHLNRGRALMAERAERHLLAELNIAAADRARRATAYAIAAGHGEIAMELLAPESGNDPEIERRRFELARAQAECLFLAGEVERATGLALQLVASAPDLISAASVQFLTARTYDHQGRFADEIEVIRQALAKLGIDLPRDMGEIERRIGEGIGRMQAYLGQHAVEELSQLPRMTDREKLVAMDLLFQLIPPAIQTCPPLFVLAELTMFDLATTHGVSAASAKNFVDCGIIQGGVLGDYATARRLAMAAFELLKEYSPAPVEAGVNFVFANFVSHWRAPFRESLEAFKRAKKIGRELGNVGHTAYAYALETQRLYLVGTSLDGCAEAVREANAYLRQSRARATLPAVMTVEHAVGKLRAMAVDPSSPPLTDEEAEAQIRASGNGPFMFAHFQSEAMCSFLLGDISAAARWDAAATALVRASVGIFAVADYHLFQGLILCARWPVMSADEQAAAAAILDQNLAKLANWAGHCAENFGHKQRLLAAEIGRVRGAPLQEVVTAFEDAIAAARDDFPHMRALANELQAAMWLGQGRRKLARALIQEAHYLYGVWGAGAKVRQLEQAHPEWFAVAAGPQIPASDAGTRRALTAGSLDLASAMKATRAISGEVIRERLYARLMETIVENAGAQRGCLMVVSDAGAIEIVCRVTADEKCEGGMQAEPLETAGDVCVEIVRFVMRTGEVVVLDDASAHPTYGNDSYVRSSEARSVLCLPVLLQGKILAVLYVENRAVTHAFAPDRQQVLQLIASQAAVSISNARLYDNLEQKVAARTSELAARNEDLEQAHKALTNEMKTRQAVEIELRQAQKLEAVGRLASGVAHEINTPIQFVTDSVQFLKDASTDLLGLVDKLREVQRLVLEGQPATDAATQSSEAEEQLDLSYLVENMPAAFERSLEGLDRVATIVRSMKEFAHPDAKQMVAVDLNRAIESTLTMARNEYKYVAEVEVDFAELPMVLCHAGEVNQAILNIVVNAAHAIGDIVKGTDQRGRISLRTRREGERILIEIEDTGGGIPESIRERIFDPFFTTKEVGKGTGQGLAIARSVIVDKHGGELTCRSEVGKGTTFSIRLPIDGKREASANPKAA